MVFAVTVFFRVVGSEEPMVRYLQAEGTKMLEEDTGAPFHCTKPLLIALVPVRVLPLSQASR